VAIEGRAVAFVGPTGAGKTSLAIRLVALGRRFLTDDVLSLERSAGTLLAHPGAAIAAVRPAERAAIEESTWTGLGAELGHSGKTYLELPRQESPVPLGAVYFLRLGGDEPIEPLTDPDPRLLLASTFVLGVQTPERLRNQLEVCAEIAAAVPMFSLRIAPDTGAELLAATVDAHARELLAR
jgi:HPr kinase/phosphorylase